MKAGFKAALLERSQDVLSMLRRNMVGVDLEAAADIIINSVAHLKVGDQPEDSPIYKVAAAMETLRRPDNFIGLNTRKALKDKLAALSGLKDTQVNNVLNHYDWRLPNNLQPQRKLGRTLMDVPPPPAPKPDKAEVVLGENIRELTIKAGGVEITIKLKE